MASTGPDDSACGAAAEEADKLETRGKDAASRLDPSASAEDAAAREAWNHLRTIRQLLQADARCAAAASP